MGGGVFRWVLRALASMALEEERLYSFQSTLRSVSVVSLGVSFGLCFVICGFRRGIWICLLFGSASALVSPGWCWCFTILLSVSSFLCVCGFKSVFSSAMGGGVRSWLVGMASLWVGGDRGGTSIYRQTCSWVHFVTFHYSSSVVSWVCFLCRFLPFQLCPECPVLWVGRFLVFRILWFLFPLLCPRSWWLCCVWSVFCISLLPFQSLYLCTRSWLTLLLFCLVPVVWFGGGWLVVVSWLWLSFLWCLRCLVGGVSGSFWAFCFPVPWQLHVFWLLVWGVCCLSSVGISTAVFMVLLGYTLVIILL